MPGNDKRPKAEGQRPKAEGQKPGEKGQRPTRRGAEFQNSKRNRVGHNPNSNRELAGHDPSPKRERAGVIGQSTHSHKNPRACACGSDANPRARAWGSDPDSAIADAIRCRGPLLASPHTNTLRIFNARADGIDGLVIDKFAHVAIVQIHEGRCPLDESAIKSAIEKHLAEMGVESVYRKSFAVDRSTGNAALEIQHRDPSPWIGQPAPEEFPAVENQMHFRIRPFDGASVGLFLDARENRRLLREMANGCRVLNTFAYTCGFAVAAALGGAVSTVNIDASKRYLEWGKRNFAANDLPLDGHLFYCCDVFDGFRRLAKHHHKFEIIILDPPTFGRVKGGSPFVFEKVLPRLVAVALDALTTGGRILLSTNHRPTSLNRLEDAIAAVANRRYRIVERPALPPDFAGDPDTSKSLWIEA